MLFLNHSFISIQSFLLIIKAYKVLDKFKLLFALQINFI